MRRYRGAPRCYVSETLAPSEDLAGLSSTGVHVYRRGVQYLALQAFGVARRRLLLAVLLGYALVELSLYQPAS